MNSPASDLASLRAKAYSFLASIFLEVPTKELIVESLKHPPLSMNSQGIKTLNKFLSQNELTPPERLHERLAREHLRLFGGLAHGHSPPPPYESIWRGEGKLMGKTTVAVLKAYGTASVELTSRVKEPPDHVGVELGYLSYLCGEEAQARMSNDAYGAARNLRLQYDFLHHHVQRWVPNLCEHIAKTDTTGFYRGIAILTKEFVVADEAAILEKLTEASSDDSARAFRTRA